MSNSMISKLKQQNHELTFELKQTKKNKNEKTAFNTYS
jgi:hypothetical protein